MRDRSLGHRHVDPHGVGAVLHRDADGLGDGRPALEVAEHGAMATVVGLLVEQRPQRPVVQRQHVVAFGLLPPQGDHRRQALGLRPGPVVGLRQVLGHVVELPHIVVERGVRIEAVVVDRADRVERHRLPPVVIDGARAEHLEVLRRAQARYSRAPRVEQRGEADAVEMRLRHAVEVRRGRDPGQLEHGRQDVDGMGELVPDAAGRLGETGRPAHDARIGHPALVHLALPTLERRVPGHGPPPRVVVVGGGAADLVDPSRASR